ncbi:cadherin-18 [Tachysurus ichikawai]
MRVSPTSCLCPVLLCLCFLERGYGASHHGQARLISRNHNLTHSLNRTKDGETEVHHRPKRGWIWNQFFVLEEHIGPDAQYVGKLHSNSDKGDGSVRYILSGEGAGTIFIINEVTGDIHATKSLDREKKSHYVLHAQAIDLNTNKPLEPESEFIIKVQDINDNAPKFPDGPFITSVPERSEVDPLVGRAYAQSIIIDKLLVGEGCTIEGADEGCRCRKEKITCCVFIFDHCDSAPLEIFVVKGQGFNLSTKLC